LGSTRPADTTSSAKAPNTENAEIDAPACSSVDATPLSAMAKSSPAEGLSRTTGTSKGQSFVEAPIRPEVAPSERINSGEDSGACAFPGNHTT
jgi:hypothetical protein